MADALIANGWVVEERLPAPQQRIFEGVVVPLVLVCAKGTNPSLEELTEWIASHGPELNSALVSCTPMEDERQ